jgi:integrase
MPALRRTRTKYPGVTYVKGISPVTGKPERIYYIRYRRNGKEIEEKAGRQVQDDMTPARASQVRARRIQGDELSNRERREAIKAQKEAEEGRWTLDRLWREYKSRRLDLKGKGIATDEYRYQLYLKTKFGNKEPSELAQFDVDGLRIRLLKKRKPQTVKHVLALLKRIVRFGANKGFCEALSFSIEMPKVHNQRTEDLTPEQLNGLLEAIEKDPNTQSAAIMKMALFTGMRRGEILKLKWEDVDFHRGFISLRDPKGGPDQTIPLNDVARQILSSTPKTDSPFVFPGRGGQQKTVMNKRFIRRIKKKANLPAGFRPLHGLRHTYASMLASSGKVDLYTLQKLLTHKDPRMTQRYAHLRDEALRRGSDVAGSLIKDIVDSKPQDKVIQLEDHKE